MLTNLRTDTRFDNYQADIYHQQFINSIYENPAHDNILFHYTSLNLHIFILLTQSIDIFMEKISLLFYDTL